MFSIKALAPLALAIATTTTVLTAGAVIAQPAAAAQLHSKGAFVGDRDHPAQGKASVVRLKGGGFGIKLHDDFKVRGGPDLRVWVSESKSPTGGRAVRAAEHIDLGRLRSSSGEQIYRLPADYDLAKAQSVVIWCHAFGVFFGAAALR